MRYPGNLPEGGTIGFVAPSFGCNIEPYKSAFMNAQAKFKEMGYKLWLGPNVYAGSGIGISNTPELCGAELTDAYTMTGEEAPDILISCGGGELMCTAVPFIDFDRIKEAKPKWYMGYSDNTNFVFLSAILSDTAAIYGPCAPAFGMNEWHKSLNDALEIMTGKRNYVTGYDKWEKESLKDEEHPLVPYNVTEKRELKIYGSRMDSELSLRGRLIGGCLDCLVTLTGTRFDRTKEFLEKYKDDGFIWFFESCDLNPMSMRRAYWQIKEAGWLKYVRGILIGRPLHFGEEMFGADQYNSVTDSFKDLNVPIIMDLDIGHLAPMMPLVCGAMAEVSAKGNDITISYSFN